MSTSVGQISAWGNGLAFRLTKPMAKTAGVADGSAVRVTVKPGRIVIETETEPTLEQMLAAFDPNGDPLTYQILTTPSAGTLCGTAPSLTYAPALHD